MTLHCAATRPKILIFLFFLSWQYSWESNITCFNDLFVYSRLLFSTLASTSLCELTYPCPALPGGDSKPWAIGSVADEKNWPPPLLESPPPNLQSAGLAVHATHWGHVGPPGSAGPFSFAPTSKMGQCCSLGPDARSPICLRTFQESIRCLPNKLLI